MAKTPGAIGKRSLLAIDELNRLGASPLEEIYEALQFAKDKTKKGGNFDADGKSDQSQWAALWLKAASELAVYKHPKLSAIAIKDMAMDAEKEAKPVTTLEAIKIIDNDPFNPKNITSEQVLDAMKSQHKAPLLPSGGKNE